MLSEKDLIGVEGKIHILNICDCETPAIHFAEVTERPPGLQSSACCLPQQAPLAVVLGTPSFAKEDVWVP